MPQGPFVQCITDTYATYKASNTPTSSLPFLKEKLPPATRAFTQFLDNVTPMTTDDEIVYALFKYATSRNYDTPTDSVLYEQIITALKEQTYPVEQGNQALFLQKTIEIFRANIDAASDHKFYFFFSQIDELLEKLISSYFVSPLETRATIFIQSGYLQDLHFCVDPHAILDNPAIQTAMKRDNIGQHYLVKLIRFYSDTSKADIWLRLLKNNIITVTTTVDGKNFMTYWRSFQPSTMTEEPVQGLLQHPILTTLPAQIQSELLSLLYSSPSHPEKITLLQGLAIAYSQPHQPRAFLKNLIIQLLEKEVRIQYENAPYWIQSLLPFINNLSEVVDAIPQSMWQNIYEKNIHIPTEDFWTLPYAEKLFDHYVFLNKKIAEKIPRQTLAEETNNFIKNQEIFKQYTQNRQNHNAQYKHDGLNKYFESLKKHPAADNVINEMPTLKHIPTDISDDNEAAFWITYFLANRLKIMMQTTVSNEYRFPPQPFIKLNNVLANNRYYKNELSLSLQKSITLYLGKTLRLDEKAASIIDNFILFNLRMNIYLGHFSLTLEDIFLSNPISNATLKDTLILLLTRATPTQKDALQRLRLFNILQKGNEAAFSAALKIATHNDDDDDVFAEKKYHKNTTQMTSLNKTPEKVKPALSNIEKRIASAGEEDTPDHSLLTRFTKEEILEFKSVFILQINTSLKKLESKKITETRWSIFVEKTLNQLLKHFSINVNELDNEAQNRYTLLFMTNYFSNENNANNRTFLQNMLSHYSSDEVLKIEDVTLFLEILANNKAYAESILNLPIVQAALAFKQDDFNGSDYFIACLEKQLSNDTDDHLINVWIHCIKNKYTNKLTLEVNNQTIPLIAYSSQGLANIPAFIDLDPSVKTQILSTPYVKEEKSYHVVLPSCYDNTLPDLNTLLNVAQTDKRLENTALSGWHILFKQIKTLDPTRAFTRLQRLAFQFAAPVSDLDANNIFIKIISVLKNNPDITQEDATQGSWLEMLLIGMENKSAAIKNDFLTNILPAIPEKMIQAFRSNGTMQRIINHLDDYIDPIANPVQDDEKYAWSVVVLSKIAANDDNTTQLNSALPAAAEASELDTVEYICKTVRKSLLLPVAAYSSTAIINYAHTDFFTRMPASLSSESKAIIAKSIKKSIIFIMRYEPHKWHSLDFTVGFFNFLDQLATTLQLNPIDLLLTNYDVISANYFWATQYNDRKIALPESFSFIAQNIIVPPDTTNKNLRDRFMAQVFAQATAYTGDWKTKAKTYKLNLWVTNTEGNSTNTQCANALLALENHYSSPDDIEKTKDFIKALIIIIHYRFSSYESEKFDKAFYTDHLKKPLGFLYDNKGTLNLPLCHKRQFAFELQLLLQELYHKGKMNPVEMVRRISLTDTIEFFMGMLTLEDEMGDLQYQPYDASAALSSTRSGVHHGTYMNSSSSSSSSTHDATAAQAAQAARLSKTRIEYYQ
jgi:hypothetical protein